MNALNFFGRAANELRAAREKHPNEEGVLSDAEWLAVLTEEVGECARAIQDEDDACLTTELAQVAAVAARWAVSIPHGRVRPPWATPTPTSGPECRALRASDATGPACACTTACALNFADAR